MPSHSRKATKRRNSDSGLSRSATVVNGWPLATSHAPAVVPVAHVGQRDHRAPAGGDGRVDAFHTGGVAPGDDLVPSIDGSRKTSWK